MRASWPTATTKRGIPTKAPTNVRPGSGARRKYRDRPAGGAYDKIAVVILELTPDELLSTTRAVRKRLDLTRPVEREVLEECLRLAQQAPTASYSQNWHFVVVTDPESAPPSPTSGAASPGRISSGGQAENSQFVRIGEAVRHLAQHLHEVPVHVIPCVHGRTEDKPVAWQASIFGSIVPAAWSFMLAARSRGLGSVWTTFHLMHERAAAEILGSRTSR